MNFNTRCFVVALVSISLSLVYKFYNDVFRPLPRPKFDTEEYWGPGFKTSYKEDTAITPYNLTYSEKDINELNERLAQHKQNFHEPLEGVNFEYGFNSRALKEIIKYWRNDYLPRWNERQQYLQQLHHYSTQIQGLRIHFIHEKPKITAKKIKVVYPVLLLHGWPGSVREFYDVIPQLVNGHEGSQYVFEVVAPSLPGYGWSQPPSKIGFGPAEMSVVLRNLMLRLGYKKFFIQGGDWGALLGDRISTLFPQNVIGFHSNFCVHQSPISFVKLLLANLCPSLFFPQSQIDFHFPISEKLSTLIEESGYFHLQATKPDTIGITLTDNPVGLAAYILEKFSIWTNRNYINSPDGGLGKDIKMDALLDNIMIYYLTNSITTSQRLYAEAMSSKQRSLHMERVPIYAPFGCARFRYDMMQSFDWQLEEKYKKIVHSKYYQDGGHFAAMQVPEILYKDFLSFVSKALSAGISISSSNSGGGISGAKVK